MILLATVALVSSLAGEWDMTAQDPNGGERSIVLKFEVTGETISGTASANPLEQVRFVEGVLTFRVNYEGRMYSLRATLKNGILAGGWESESGRTGSWTARKKPEAPLAGIWQCRATAGETPDRAFTLNLKQSGHQVTGFGYSSRGEAAISRGSFKEGRLEIVIPTEEGEYTLMGALSQGRLRGEWKRSDNRAGAWEGEKK
jgi:hypothetical protein